MAMNTGLNTSRSLLDRSGTPDRPQISPAGEAPSGTADEDRADRRVDGGGPHSLQELGAELGGPGVQRVRAVQLDVLDGVVTADADALVVRHAIGTPALGSFRLDKLSRRYWILSAAARAGVRR
jgi:hypothetical protein